MEESGQIGVSLSSERSSGEKSQFVGILAHSRDSNRSGPVEVQVAHLVGHELQLVRIQGARVVDDVVRARTHSALASKAGYQVKVITGRKKTEKIG